MGSSLKRAVGILLACILGVSWGFTQETTKTSSTSGEQQGFVHFVVCDRSGEWVIVDMQNAHQPDYQSVKPRTREDCNRLLVQRLQGYLQ